MADMNTVYLLVAITAGGIVNHSTFQTAQQCDEAASLALYGETVEQYQKTEDDIQGRIQEYLDSFYKKHPPRPPKNKEEEARIAREKDLRATGGLGGPVSWAPCGHGETCGMSVTDDYMIQDMPGPYFGNGWGGPYSPDRGQWVQILHRQPVVKYATDIKTAECIKTEGERQ